MKVKIHYENCEHKGELELEIKCIKSERVAVIGFIDNFKLKQPFHHSPKDFIDELKRYGFEAKEIIYDEVIH